MLQGFFVFTTVNLLQNITRFKFTKHFKYGKD